MNNTNNTDPSNLIKYHPGCVPLTSLESSDFALAISVIVIASLAIGFLIFILYLTFREAKTVKYNIRRLSEIERESFSVRRPSHNIPLETLSPDVDGRRPTLDDLYETILPQYADTLSNVDNMTLESDSSTQEVATLSTKRWATTGYGPWQQDGPDVGPDEDGGNTEAVLRMLFVPGDFERRMEDGSLDLSSLGGSSRARTRPTSSSVKDRMKRSFNQMRYSLHSTSSLVEGESKSSFSSFNNIEINPDGLPARPSPSPLPDQHHHSVTSLSELGRRSKRRNGSVPSQLNGAGASSGERKVVGGILRRDSSRLQTDFEHRMRTRRVAVSFNSHQTTPRINLPDLVQNRHEESGSTDL